MSLLTLNPDSGVNSVLIAVQWCQQCPYSRTVVSLLVSYPDSGVITGLLPGQWSTVVYSARQWCQQWSTVPDSGVQCQTVYPDPYHGAHPVPARGTHHPLPGYPLPGTRVRRYAQCPAHGHVDTAALSRMSVFGKMVTNGCLITDPSAYKRMSQTC